MPPKGVGDSNTTEDKPITAEDVASLYRMIGFAAGVPLPASGVEYIPPEGMSNFCSNISDLAKDINKRALLKKSKDKTHRDKTIEELHVGARNLWKGTLRQNVKNLHVLVRIVNSKVYWGKVKKVRHELFYYSSPEAMRFEFIVKTLLARCEVTLAAAELKAQEKLRSLITEECYGNYLVSDSIVHKAKSGIGYIIRKNRPTIAMRGSTVICALCLHPMGYYAGTWTGALSPTDEVIAHLLMLRGDEHYFWKKANHIGVDESNSGI